VAGASVGRGIKPIDPSGARSGALDCSTNRSALVSAETDLTYFSIFHFCHGLGGAGVDRRHRPRETIHPVLAENGPEKKRVRNGTQWRAIRCNGTQLFLKKII